MKAFRLKGPKQLVEEEVEIPKAEKNGVLVKVKAAGVCRTDFKFREGILRPEFFGGKYPITMGHEISGEVAEVGENVTTLRPGDYVYINYGVFCGKCRYCLTGRDNLCVNRIMPGFGIDGGFADYIYVPSSASVVKMGKNVPPEEAAVLGCGGVTAFHSVKKSGVGPGDVAAVFGCGGVGLLVIQAVKLFGATAVAIDIRDKALDIAKKNGADITINPKTVDAVKEVFNMTEGRGADAVFEFVATDQSYETAFKMLGRSGRLMMIGSGDGVFKTTSGPMIGLETQVMSAAGGTAMDYINVAKLADGRKLVPNITKVGKLDFDQLIKFFEEMERGEIFGRAVMKA
ncbi:MAG: alcohol dehydrogenase catalytic domain-containing protein [Methanobacteriota archaeon]